MTPLTMEDKIALAYKDWKSDSRKHLYYELTDNDHRVAKIAAMYSEDDLRHATVMRAAHNRMQPDVYIQLNNPDNPPTAA